MPPGPDPDLELPITLGPCSNREFLSKLIDPHRIGAVGVSLGAITVLGLGYNTCCIDKRVSAVVSISGTKYFPGVGSSPRTEFPGTFSYPSTPLLLIRGGEANTDPGPYYISPELFSEAHTPKFLLTVTHGAHVPINPEDGAGGAAARQAVIDFLDRYLKHDKHGLDRLTRDTNNPGINTLDSAPRYPLGSPKPRTRAHNNRRPTTPSIPDRLTPGAE